nr:TaqI-like C-terminal specificity domain-containing protein [Ereboglobus sp. PH5-5]
MLRGRDIKRYSYTWASLYIIATFPALKIDIERYPAVKAHLLSFGMERVEQTGKSYIIDGKRITARKKTGNKWFETQDQIGYWEDFSKPKIIWAELARTGNAFTFDCGNYCVSNTGYILILNKKAESVIGYELLLAFLNSKAILFYLDTICSRLDQTGWRWLRQFVEVLPVPQIEKSKHGQLAKLIMSELQTKTTFGQIQIEKSIEDCFGFNELERNYLQTHVLPL